ncbi:hypothetical protein Pcinc_003666 [Petrolisthes cinctipes]|uniref:PiggyBac transposable element-derived protein domain-containing protein n=1 Tax=Petrolisthes cinctipes TaxID=88211 RepID=A0AAE1L1T6_PETCI|nr:hypothetical protein Pcinc_003666 [Petrolisthes cinctipes]
MSRVGGGEGDLCGESVEEEPAAHRKARTRVRPQRHRVWKKEDICISSLPEFSPLAPDCILSPWEYFLLMLPIDLLEDVVYQTNLYAKQKDVNTSFSIDIHELMQFIGIVIYKGVVHLPSIEDYWATKTRIPQVADMMASKRFRLIRSLLHFNNNENVQASTDRFFKVRPFFSGVTKQFQKVAETPTQSVDEVMVAYKGTRAGSLRQYMQNKPDKWGYKLFCRASIDGFIHDILLYQGETTFKNHPTELSQEESDFQVTIKTVIALVKTLKKPKETAIYADNWFTSISLVEYLKEKYGCRYVGTARPNRIGDPPLRAVKDMEKKSVPRGALDYHSTDGILALRWKDNKIVTVISSDAGVEPLKTVLRYDREQKKKVEVTCPSVIKEYNGKMGGIDKSDMLTHLYKSPMRARRWYMKLFGYVLDLCICNAWPLYKRDCKALKEKPMPLKNFRLEISWYARGHKVLTTRMTRLSQEAMDMKVPKRGQKTQLPHENVRFNNREWHLPQFVTNRQTCKHCSTKDDVHRTRWMCTVCQVALCLSDSRNCFRFFHVLPEKRLCTSASSSASPSSSV